VCGVELLFLFFLLGFRFNEDSTRKIYNKKRRFYYSKLKKTNHKDKTTVLKDRTGPRDSIKYRYGGGQQGKQE
jgi:hypothetical protein